MRGPYNYRNDGTFPHSPRTAHHHIRWLLCAVLPWSLIGGALRVLPRAVRDRLYEFSVRNRLRLVVRYRGWLVPRI
jgi:predicted DCC family thiol-disulfide oxidoreductase YuxK